MHLVKLMQMHKDKENITQFLPAVIKKGNKLGFIS